ncbi:hydroxymethylglutaryl-CoA lyase [Siccirubricoccus sp. KC 17139]|uniref:Hydroxymethylglutaryl-CoA lyase n=1 Tax=Siccirubricoccus soli TaxID=2899147 RepID=A0ABT1D0R8_9PROT|nr:hydroxymethylglutaryl-CoA lyase [Siccirubricoccus soli]MCO6415506.1 hydroxymethylglutaryl-CoA lyase [Siccirubricoccus soli]MCP2681638.1 hydroxymethylglutaryl-CoA lyase [Siccirubricoccus soli]
MSDIPSEEEMAEIAGAPGEGAARVILCECFARDGLQHEARIIPAEAKIAMIERIADCGFRRIEITSFSHPTHVPQFADAEQVLKGVRRRPGVLFKATCPNPQAVKRALAAREGGWGPEEISLLVSASEGHTRKNLRRSREEQWANVAEMAKLGRDAFVMVGTISVAFDCPFDGPTAPDRVLEDAQRFAELGVTRIAIGDTIGSATPPRVRDLIGWLHGALPTATFIAHFHDSRGTGLANTLAAIEAGLTHADTSLGGTGGHPAKIAYGEGFTGNTCTEDLATALAAMGYETGLDLEALRAAGLEAERMLGRSLGSRTLRMAG